MEKITKVYHLGAVKVPALSGVSLSIEAGEFVGITGPSGSGKTTLMNLIGCLDRPTSGRYIFEKLEVSALDDDTLAEIRNKRIGFVFQTFNLFPRATALENVEMPLLYRGLTQTRDIALAALEAVGLKERINHRPSELSGGESQRVAIARAMVGAPAVILADEPTGNLDTKMGEEIMEIFTALNKKGTIIVLVTHEPHIARYASKILSLKDGRLEI